MSAASASAAAAAQPGTEVRPLGELSYQVEIQGGPSIGRFAECTGLAAEWETTDYVEGGNDAFVHRLRGGVRYPNVTLKRGLTVEDGLLRWFFAVRGADERPNVIIRLNDARGARVREFALSKALPIRWTGPSASSGSSTAATESLEIAHLGFV